MANIKFTKDANNFTFSVPRSYPVDDPAAVNVVTDYSEGKQLYAYDKGISEQFFNLTFSNASAADFGNFENWLKNIAVGPKNTFTYRDESSTDHTVRLLDTKNPLRKTAQNKYSGTIRLRKEI